MILLLHKCSRYKARKCNKLPSEVLPGWQERDDFFLLLVYLHFLDNFKCTCTVRGVYDVIAIALLFLKSKIQSSTQGPGAEHRWCDRGLAFSVCVRGQTPKSGAEPVLAPPIAMWALPTPGLTWWIMWIMWSYHSRIPWLESPETLPEVSGPDT